MFLFPQINVFSPRPITELRRVVSVVFYCLLSAVMLRSEARYELRERRDLTNMTQLILDVATHHSQPAQARQEAQADVILGYQHEQAL